MKNLKTDERTPAQRALSRALTEIYWKVKALKLTRKNSAWVHSYALCYFNHFEGWVPDHLEGWEKMLPVVQEFWPTVNQDVEAIYRRFEKETSWTAESRHPLLT